jgi:hypothetical protein
LYPEESNLSQDSLLEVTFNHNPGDGNGGGDGGADGIGDGGAVTVTETVTCSLPPLDSLVEKVMMAVEGPG